MREKLRYPIMAAIASVGILYLDIFTIGIKTKLLSNCPDDLRTIYSLGFTIILWSISAAYLLWAVRDKIYPLRSGRTVKREKNTVFCVLIVLSITAVMWILNGQLKPLKELTWFLAFGKTTGWLGFILQNIYYILEMLLALMIVIYSQTAGELLTRRNHIPWGSLFLSLTWGLPHILTKDFSTGIFSLVFGFALGALYPLSGRSGKTALLYMSLAFIL